jgi:hypothetical protein
MGYQVEVKSAGNSPVTFYTGWKAFVLWYLLKWNRPMTTKLYRRWFACL